ncbi:MAG: hypothetical protein CSB48_02785 [Proteobacteria bacterium]|nr:MAG: hypothetical protein CSB48_02785 [Pseudomonadota bacterium]
MRLNPYYTEFEKHHSLIFADHPNLRITGIIDYHESEDAPGWCQHRVEYKCPLSRQWQRWNEVNQKYLSQTQFAEFIEDNIADIVHPDGQELMEMVLQFQQIQKAVFGSSHRLQSGEFSIQYSQENQKGTFELPETITLGIPVFHNGEKYEVKAKLRYRIKEGELKLMLALKESERITEDAFTGVIKKIQPDCTNVVIEGTAPHQSTHYSI